ncbi:MAG TPA: hypothetical protein VFO26_16895 [Gaiella sp.]|uniref:hypothetical protein n=1 Tax=Gaiella sp. TaxID=2663207 RepID=UPI002D8026CF|nr:hypothetical protein [Gaiella sp.]HET9289233.1 hypothetical protein [Gaiella sp.]
MGWTNVARGTLELHVDEVDVHVPTGSRWRDELRGIALPVSTLRETLGGEEGLVTDEFGDSHPISIAEWADRDPETRLLVWFTYQQQNAPDGFRGSIYPPDVLERAHPVGRRAR